MKGQLLINVRKDGLPGNYAASAVAHELIGHNFDIEIQTRKDGVLLIAYARYYVAPNPDTPDYIQESYFDSATMFRFEIINSIVKNFVSNAKEAGCQVW